jgi:hypothetical protein
MDSFFQEEEQYVAKDFDLKYEGGTKLLRRLLELSEELIGSSGFRNDQYPEYSIVIHALHALMALNNSLVLLSKGYMGDAEAVHKRAVEFLLRAIYFKEFPDEEERWREKKGKLPDRKSMAELLDNKHKEKRIFPTDHEKLWGEFVYGAIYKSVNEWAHGDFEAMYCEVAINDGTKYYTNKLSVGPKANDDFVKRKIKSLINSCRMQVLFLVLTSSCPREKYHDLMIESEQYILTE